MAKYEQQLISKKAYDLALYCEKVVRNFSGINKCTLGTELREASREVIRLIRAAIDGDNRVLVLLAPRNKAFANFNSFHYAINEVVESASKMKEIL